MRVMIVNANERASTFHETMDKARDICKWLISGLTANACGENLQS